MQVLTAICVCLTSISWAANAATSSAMIFAFQKDSDDLMKMTLEEASWLRKRELTLFERQANTKLVNVTKNILRAMPCKSISATLFAVATIPGTALGGVMADKWGRKLTMYTTNILAYGFWIITAFASNKYLLYMSYSFQGFFGIIGLNLVGKYK